MSAALLRAAVWLQERLASGYCSLAQRLQGALHMNVSVAPAGLAWEQVHRTSAGSAAAELPAGKILSLSGSSRWLHSAAVFSLSPSGLPQALGESWRWANILCKCAQARTLSMHCTIRMAFIQALLGRFWSPV